MIRVLERLQRTRSLPRSIVCDNGRSLWIRGRIVWPTAHTAVRFIGFGDPVQNAYVELVNGRFRDECLKAE